MVSKTSNSGGIRLSLKANTTGIIAASWDDQNQQEIKGEYLFAAETGISRQNCHIARQLRGFNRRAYKDRVITGAGRKDHGCKMCVCITNILGTSVEGGQQPLAEIL